VPKKAFPCILLWFCYVPHFRSIYVYYALQISIQQTKVTCKQTHVSDVTPQPNLPVSSLTMTTVSWLRRLVAGFSPTTRVRSKIRSCRTFGEQTGTGAGFSQSASASLLNYYPTNSLTKLLLLLLVVVLSSSSSSSLAKHQFLIRIRFCQTCLFLEIRPTGFHSFGFRNNNFVYRARTSALDPNPNLEDQDSAFMFASDRVAQL
jgi:hypothetical protein